MLSDAPWRSRVQLHFVAQRRARTGRSNSALIARSVARVRELRSPGSDAMRAFSAAWPDRAIVQGPLARITWYHNIALLEKVSTQADRLWYARQAAEHGWSHTVLVLQIESRPHQRHGKAVSNFKSTLPPMESDMAAHVFKDPYLFDFLGTADPRREREVEQALVDHIQRFLLELGTGFAFVGRQVLLEVGDQDFYADLLFYHLKLRRYVVTSSKPSHSPQNLSAR
jgi:predicted nuclease of restriction endonuclease-like (RecB) superfamily